VQDKILAALLSKASDNTTRSSWMWFWIKTNKQKRQITPWWVLQSRT